MRRLFHVLLPVIVSVPTIAVGSTASATPPGSPPCASQYDLALAAVMGDPDDPDVEDVSFTMTRTSGTCVSGPWPPDQFGGNLTGNCGATFGSGWLPNGHWFEVVWAGTSLTMAGDAAGAFVISVPMDCASTTFDTAGAISSVSTADVCYGVGIMTLGEPFTIVSTTTTSFSLGITLGLCAMKLSFSAVGTVTGGCSEATGTGVTSNGATFDVLWIDNNLLLTGNVIGVINVQPDALSGQSCLTGAEHFLANVKVTKLR